MNPLHPKNSRNSKSKAFFFDKIVLEDINYENLEPQAAGEQKEIEKQPQGPIIDENEELEKMNNQNLAAAGPSKIILVESKENNIKPIASPPSKPSLKLVFSYYFHLKLRMTKVLDKMNYQKRS